MQVGGAYIIPTGHGDITSLDEDDALRIAAASYTIILFLYILLLLYAPIFKSTCVYRITEPVENKSEIITKTPPRPATYTSFARVRLFRPRIRIGYLVGSTCKYTLCIFRYRCVYTQVTYCAVVYPCVGSTIIIRPFVQGTQSLTKTQVFAHNRDVYYDINIHDQYNRFMVLYYTHIQRVHNARRLHIVKCRLFVGRSAGVRLYARAWRLRNRALLLLVLTQIYIFNSYVLIQVFRFICCIIIYYYYHYFYYYYYTRRQTADKRC